MDAGAHFGCEQPPHIFGPDIFGPDIFGPDIFGPDIFGKVCGDRKVARLSTRTFEEVIWRYSVSVSLLGLVVTRLAFRMPWLITVSYLGPGGGCGSGRGEGPGPGGCGVGIGCGGGCGLGIGCGLGGGLAMLEGLLNPRSSTGSAGRVLSEVGSCQSAVPRSRSNASIYHVVSAVSCLRTSITKAIDRSITCSSCSWSFASCGST